MPLFQIIKALQGANGSNAKLALLQEHKDNELLKAYLRATYDPALSYYQKKLPCLKTWPVGHEGFNQQDIDFVIGRIASRSVTGHSAIAELGGHTSALTPEGRELMRLLISRSVGAGIGDTLILKVFPGLWFSVPYQRCSLLDNKAKERFAKLPLMYVQPKLDGSFVYLVKEVGKAPEAITRAGSRYPQAFAEKLAKGVPEGSVLVGELLVYASEHSEVKLLDRQTGNGILNSILKSSDEGYEHLQFQMTAWDLLTPEEFKAGKSEMSYVHRLDVLDEIEAANVNIIKTFPVNSVALAYKIYSEHTARGEEGCVLKNPDAMWGSGTSKDMVKMKISFEIDLEITHVTEGTGKAKGMMGAVGVKSLEGILQSDVGTGWTDEARKYVWEIREQIIGGILTVKANDIISNRSNEGKSLFLPVAIELRNDKFVADSYEHCVAQLNAAKGI